MAQKAQPSSSKPPWREKAPVPVQVLKKEVRTRVKFGGTRRMDSSAEEGGMWHLKMEIFVPGSTTKPWNDICQMGRKLDKECKLEIY